LKQNLGKKNFSFSLTVFLQPTMVIPIKDQTLNLQHFLLCYAPEMIRLYIFGQIKHKQMSCNRKQTINKQNKEVDCSQVARGLQLQKTVSRPKPRFPAKMALLCMVYMDKVFLSCID
jgi:hypothetical protein